MRYEFTIPVPRTLPGGNIKQHWAARMRQMRDMKNTSWGYASNARARSGLPRATGKRHVTLTLLRGPRQKMMDADNIMAGLKPVIDGLKLANWIVDDAPHWLSLTLLQKRGDEPEVLVAVEWTVEGVVNVQPG